MYWDISDSGTQAWNRPSPKVHRTRIIHILLLVPRIFIFFHKNLHLFELTQRTVPHNNGTDLRSLEYWSF